ncbi:hypothetical protein BFGS084_00200 [Bacteroides fragilis]|nr:hypothetical protein BFGS084_00200 [Bacteroides fragilis]
MTFYELFVYCDMLLEQYAFCFKLKSILYEDKI